MKTNYAFPILLSMILLAGCQTATENTSGDSPTSTANSGNEGKTTLIVEYDESQFMDKPTRYNTIDNEMDRFIYLEHNFESVFGKKLGQYNLDFQLYPATAPEDAAVLELSFLAMDSPSPIELELRMWVILRKGDSVKDFGIVRSLIVPQRPMTQGSVERDLDAIYSDMAGKVLEMIITEL